MGLRWSEVQILSPRPNTNIVAHHRQDGPTWPWAGQWHRRYRSVYALIAIASLALLGYAYFAQYYHYLDPCPLCILQRVAVGLIGVNALIALCHAPNGRARWVYTANGTFIPIIGSLIAGRHLYLQSLPPESVPECGPGLDYIISTLPMAEAIEKIFTGSGECAATSWTFVGITMPGWVLVWMLVFGAASICSLWADQRTS